MVLLPPPLPRLDSLVAPAGMPVIGVDVGLMPACDIVMKLLL